MFIYVSNDSPDDRKDHPHILLIYIVNPTSVERSARHTRMTQNTTGERISPQEEHAHSTMCLFPSTVVHTSLIAFKKSLLTSPRPLNPPVHPEPPSFSSGRPSPCPPLTSHTTLELLSIGTSRAVPTLSGRFAEEPQVIHQVKDVGQRCPTSRNQSNTYPH